MTAQPSTLGALALSVLETADATVKANASLVAAAQWRAGGVPMRLDRPLPARPARPERPELLAPAKMPKRKKAGSLAGRIALLHALAHIELNAIDLAWDMAARFLDQDVPTAFVDDWITVGADEAKHHLLLADRLAAFGSYYGALPAHDGLWQASMNTAQDLAARLAVVPMVLEARGLDVTPAMIAGARQVGDEESAQVLQIIHDDEISHVAFGRQWFGWVCEQRGVSDAGVHWQALVRQFFDGPLRPPFNVPSRDRAAFEYDWYAPLASDLERIAP